MYKYAQRKGRGRNEIQKMVFSEWQMWSGSFHSASCFSEIVYRKHKLFVQFKTSLKKFLFFNK